MSETQTGTWTMENSPYVATGWIRAPPGESLTIAPGVVVKFEDGHRGIRVNGTLRAEGTAAQPIVFTALTDDVGGDTNGDGTETVPAPGYWNKIRLYDGSEGTLTHCQIRYAGYGAGTTEAAVSREGNAACT